MAYTGTGKTAAYLVPLLGAMMKTQRYGMPKNRYYPSAIVLQPTRELVQQVSDRQSSHGADAAAGKTITYPFSHGCLLVPVVT